MDTLFGHGEIRVAVVGRNLDDLIPVLAEFPCIVTEENPQLVISHGGDGSLLGAEQRYPGIPKCAIRDRKNNPKCPRHSERQQLQELFAGKLQPSYLDILELSNDRGETLIAINDFCIERQIASGAIRYRISQNGSVFREQVVADALIISTVFGSTGYFQSITHGSFQNGIGLAYSNALDLSVFNLLSADSNIGVTILRGPAYVIADNNPKMLTIQTGETLSVRMLPRKTLLYGLDALRCPDCYVLRKNGVPTASLPCNK